MTFCVRSQEKQAREFLLNQGEVEASELAVMTTEEVISKIETWAESNDYMIILADEDIGLIPKSAKQYWFSR
ncbi:hypothetical protein [Staphylococcus delphini]|uniref:Uncharacterized protein n=1 Tax=Staphylococcus delphini TaxID=53344 RepID=A0AAX0QU31_9STAP|nr:hypothetical protein [Staphylococcus delphini]PCF50093.1 hypothetical protein B5C07_07755 [Staphylococcus delphini]PNZ95714.1 hypothetical protein CD148_03295 [Staphylococcus delphini]RIZ56275.1 hypothetical protein CDL68_01670 [Staphylococcus delphini]VED62507.1 Uncharacterised protein [Staphylococcus delphini]